MTGNGREGQGNLEEGELVCLLHFVCKLRLGTECWLLRVWC